MSGLYLHIPFCKQACHYCNFHFSTSLKYKGQLLQAMYQEIVLQKDYLDNKLLQSVYFGGGTPSLLSQNDIEQFFDVIRQHFSIADDAEITLEANPDDLNLDKLKALQKTPINRLSIGIQSFSDTDLQFMNRAHNAHEAHSCIENALKVGFKNLTIDLIYGSPTTSNDQWLANLEKVLQYKIPHISSYCLTVEPQTALDHFVKTGKAQAVDEEKAAQQFEMLIDQTRKNGYEHYEISNFALPGCYAKHNSSYWLGESYLGIGPSAHSFNGQSRQWNVAHNVKYIKAITENRPQDVYEVEHLNKTQRYNEYIMTGLRTKWGCQLEKIAQFGKPYADYFVKSIQAYIAEGLAVQSGDQFRLTDKGKLLADRIASELFYD